MELLLLSQLPTVQRPTPRHLHWGGRAWLVVAAATPEWLGTKPRRAAHRSPRRCAQRGTHVTQHGAHVKQRGARRLSAN